MYNAADTYHKPQSRSILCPTIFFHLEKMVKKKLRDKIIIFTNLRREIFQKRDTVTRYLFAF